MNCSTLRQNLLGSDHPSVPTAQEGGHLVSCPACSAWHGRLIRLEGRLPLLPVPACPVPTSLLAQIRTPALRIAGSSREASRPRDLQRVRQKLALAFSLAASLAIFTVGWWALPQIAPDRPNVVVVANSYEHQRSRKIGVASTPNAKARALADLADDFLAEVRQKPNDPARLAVLAGYFDRLVHEDLMLHLREVSPGERPGLVSALTRRLRMIEDESSRLATEWRTVHSGSVVHLRRIAASAHEANDRLQRLG